MKSNQSLSTTWPPHTANATTPSLSDSHEDVVSPRSVESREKTLRNIVKKWFGHVEAVDTKARTAELTRQEVILHLLLHLHRISCNLVPEPLRIPLQEQDVFSAIILLNRIAITLGSPVAAILCYCEVRAVRENNLRFNQIDPLQLRHLLTFHQDIPHEALNALDIQRLRVACETADITAIRNWYATISKRKTILPKDAPQFLRRLASDVWNAGHEDFLDTYAKELAVLDATLFDVLGWENTRFFFALFTRIQGAEYCPAAAFLLTKADIVLAIEQSTQLGNADEVLHFHMLLARYNEQAFQRLEHTILAAAKENILRALEDAIPVSPKPKKKNHALLSVFRTLASFPRNHIRQAAST